MRRTAPRTGRSAKRLPHLQLVRVLREIQFRFSEFRAVALGFQIEVEGWSRLGGLEGQRGFAGLARAEQRDGRGFGEGSAEAREEATGNHACNHGVALQKSKDSLELISKRAVLEGDEKRNSVSDGKLTPGSALVLPATPNWLMSRKNAFAARKLLRSASMSSVNVIASASRVHKTPLGVVDAPALRRAAAAAGASPPGTDALEAELARTRSECERRGQRLHAIMDGLPAGVLLLDGCGRVVESNGAARDLLGEPEAQERFDELLARRRVGPDALIGHIELTGGRFVSLARRPAGEGEIVLLSDVTEAHLMQSVLDRQQRLLTLGELAAGLAHQIRTPLASALLYATRMGMPNQALSELRRCGTKAAEALRSLDRLIGDMLAFARGNSQIEPLDVNALLEQVAQWIRPLLRPGMVLTIKTEAPDLSVAGNAPSLVSALLNLATNALQAATGPVKLELLARRAPGGGAEIRVCDDGPGIPPALRARVFEPFFTTRARGTGIGLGIVKSIIEAHRGSVRLDETSGGGACFIIDLPADVRP